MPPVAMGPRAALLQTLVIGSVFIGSLFVLLVVQQRSREIDEFRQKAMSMLEHSRRESEIAGNIVEELVAYSAASEYVSQDEIERFQQVAARKYPLLVSGLLGLGDSGRSMDRLVWSTAPTPFLAGLLEDLRRECAAEPPGAMVRGITRTDADGRRVAGLFKPVEDPQRGCAVLVVPSGAGAAQVSGRAEFAGLMIYLFVSADPQEPPWRCLEGGQGPVSCPSVTTRQGIEERYALEWRVSGDSENAKGAPVLLVVPRDQRTFIDFVVPSSWLTLVITALATLGVALLRYRGARDRAAVAHSERRYRALIEATPIGVVSWDDSGAIRDWNSAVEKLLGWTREESLGAPVTSRLHAASGPPLVVGPPAALAEGGFQEIPLQRADGGTVLVEALVRATKFESGWQYGVLIRDMTAQRAADAERQQVERLVGAATLASGFAHDFNNLLTVITGSLDFIAAELAPGSPAREDLATAQDAAGRAAAMVRNMLHVTRRREAAVTMVRLDGEIARLQAAMKQVLGARIALRLQLGAGAACIAVDCGWFESALLNLLINSRHAMHSGGTVTVSTRVEERRALIEVVDDGSGMTPEVVARAFEPFFTTKPEGVGNGLGLPMVRSFARTYGGEAEVESQVGKGTTVRIRLALVGAAPNAVTESRQDPA